MVIKNPFVIGVLTGIIGGTISGWILYYSQMQTTTPFSFIVLSCLTAILMLIFLGVCFRERLNK